MFHFEGDQGRYGMRNPPLQRALVDLQYPVSPRLLTNDGLSELHDRLIDDFPIMRPAAPLGFSISIGNPAMVGMPGQDTRYQFINESGFDVIIGTSNATVSLSGRAYREQAQLSGILSTVAASMADVGRITQCDRIGVRYVNAAPASRAEWRAWFKPEFTGWTETGILDQSTERVAMLITQLSCKESDDVTSATIRHGYLPAGIGQDVTESEASNKPSFLVDIDMAIENKFKFQAEEIAAQFRLINHKIARYLRHTFSPEGETHFGVYSLEGAQR